MVVLCVPHISSHLLLINHAGCLDRVVIDKAAGWFFEVGVGGGFFGGFHVSFAAYFRYLCDVKKYKYVIHLRSLFNYKITKYKNSPETEVVNKTNIVIDHVSL